MCGFNEFYFITKAQMNITITTPVLLERCGKYPRVRRAVEREPSKREKERAS